MIGALIAVRLACPQNGQPLPPGTRLELVARRAWVTVEGGAPALRFLSPAGGVECSLVGNVLQLRLPEDLDELRLQVPAVASVSIRVLEGDVDLRSVQANVSVDAGTGSVRIAEVRGSVTARSAAGKVELADIVGPISASAQHNEVRLSRTRGDVEASNITGMTYLENVEAVNLSATTVTGEVRCTCIASGSGTWEIRAHYGGVSVSVQKGASLVATLDTAPHTAFWSLPGSTSHQDDRRRVTIARGDGGTRMFLTSFSGGVTLRERER